MKKFINAAESLQQESLSGFSAIHSRIVQVRAGGKYVIRAKPDRTKVALISGGGSGHEPLHAGFVGTGMLDAACPGQIFTSPTPDQITEAAAQVCGERGGLFIVKNYSGDVMNFEIGSELHDGPTSTVIVDDDVAMPESARSAGRRGVAGTVIVEKIVGAAAERGGSLDALTALGRDVNRRTKSIGVALTSCTMPATGKPTFVLDDDEMEMGVGIHGEAGQRRMRLAPAKMIAQEMIAAIIDRLEWEGFRGCPAILLVNGFGGTPAIELYLMAEMARAALLHHGVTLARGLVGNYVTSLEMAGCSLTVSAVNDELLELWDAPVHTAALSWGHT